jgi:hypothetical protein
MSRSCGHLIIISPGFRGPWETQLSQGTVAALGLAILAPFLFLAVMGYTFPPAVSDGDRSRLEVENNALRVENKNLGLKMQQLSSRLERLEEISWGVVGLMGSD